MKIIRYYLKKSVNSGTEENPVWEETRGPECTLTYSQNNLELAKGESYGDVSVEDDGVQDDVDESGVMIDLLADHEYRLCMLELGGDI